ncbi:hypothetical protein [Ruegeria atlantica]|nr:hypothetical protein [Ruegeria atlantica]
MEGSHNWDTWKHKNAVGREHSAFFSAFTYGLGLAKMRLNAPENDRVEEIFRLLRTSSLNARILPATAEIMDLAAETLAEAKSKEDWSEDNLTPFIEYATAWASNLTLVVTDQEADPAVKFPKLLKYPISIMIVKD